MATYSNIEIDGIPCLVDPDTISVQTNNLIAVEKSMGGTTYLTFYKSNSPGYMRTVSIGGLYLPQVDAVDLQLKAAKKIPIEITSAPDNIVGCAGKFVITGVSTSPLKPLAKFPDNEEIKYNYSITLQEVDEEE